MHRRYRTSKFNHFYHIGPNLGLLADATGQGFAEVDSFHHSRQRAVPLVKWNTISASIEDFQDVIKALPQTTKIDLPGRPKRFIALGIAIAAAALSSYNAYRITELNTSPMGLLGCPASIPKTDGRSSERHFQHASLY